MTGSEESVIGTEITRCLRKKREDFFIEDTLKPFLFILMAERLPSEPIHLV